MDFHIVLCNSVDYRNAYGKDHTHHRHFTDLLFVTFNRIVTFVSVFRFHAVYAILLNLSRDMSFLTGRIHCTAAE